MSGTEEVQAQWPLADGTLHRKADMDGCQPDLRGGKFATRVSEC